jgi:hypothetical protein
MPAAHSDIRTNDGVGLVAAGDVFVVIYALPARLHRTQWLFDRMDELAVKAEGTLCGLMVILPTADSPDAATRAENARRLRALQGRLRRLVTVVIGDTFRLNLVRTIMRTMFLLQRQSHLLVVSSTLDEGLHALLEQGSSETPPRSTLGLLVRKLSEALGCNLDQA